ncbi:alternative ribosome rescue factor ArfA [Bacillus sp. JJ722]|uniref:alternative ribosome rescue factor ArfA n=1 Tax=Bacillus sp. JJ722 TaxID=3122973 RepID=UPI002FFF5643
MKKKKAKTIGQMTNSRRTWGFDASIRIVKNKKGKGSYTRKGKQTYREGAYFFHQYFITYI